MVNRHLLSSDDEVPTTEKLLQPSRVTMKYENSIKRAGLESDFVLDVVVEPFELKLGFREVEFFNSLNKSY